MRRSAGWFSLSIRLLIIYSNVGERVSLISLNDVEKNVPDIHTHTHTHGMFLRPDDVDIFYFEKYKTTVLFTACFLFVCGGTGSNLPRWTALHIHTPGYLITWLSCVYTLMEFRHIIMSAYFTFKKRAKRFNFEFIWLIRLFCVSFPCWSFLICHLSLKIC